MTADLEKNARASEPAAQFALAQKLIAEGKAEAGVDWLRKAAAAGLTEAKLALAERLLSFAPFDVFEGCKWARSAAADKNGKAEHLLSVAAAEGLGTPQDFRAALAHLEHSAALGHAPAQRELLALAGDWAGAKKGAIEGDHDTWKRLCDAIDIDAWLKSPQPRAVSVPSRILVVERFFSVEVCDWLIESARSHLKRAETFDPKTGQGHYEASRTNSAAPFNVAAMDMLLVLVRARIAALTRLPILGFEDSTVLHYAPGEEFLPHYDFFGSLVSRFGARNRNRRPAHGDRSWLS